MSETAKKPPGHPATTPRPRTPNSAPTGCFHASVGERWSGSHANILIIGKTGVGKSTLVNAVFRKPLAKAETGRPVTKVIQRFEDPSVPVTLYDTKGVELGDAKKQVIRDFKKTIAKSRKAAVEDHIHLLNCPRWLAVSVTCSDDDHADYGCQLFGDQDAALEAFAQACAAGESWTPSAPTAKYRPAIGRFVRWAA